MNEETETTNTEVVIEPTETTGVELVPDSYTGLVGIHDINRSKETIFYNIKGDIHVIHEITLGDVAIITLLAAMLIFLVLDRVIRR